MQKIYTNPRNLILAIMAELTTNQGFSGKEVGWKAVHVENELVFFDVHSKIKELLKMGISLLPNSEKKLSMNRKDSHPEDEFAWEIEVQADGAESYYFGRVLFIALAKLKSGFINIENINLELIERYTIMSALKVVNNDIAEKIKQAEKKQDPSLGFVPRAKYEYGLYQVTVPINGIGMTFSCEDVDLLCKQIGLQLRGCFKR